MSGGEIFGAIFIIGLGLFMIVCIIMAFWSWLDECFPKQTEKIIDVFRSAERKALIAKELQWDEEEEAQEEEIARQKELCIFNMKTSSTNQIQGCRIIKQFKWISVEGTNRYNSSMEDLKRNFISQAVEIGGNAVINYKERRFGSNGIAIGGDVVLIQE